MAKRVTALAFTTQSGSCLRRALGKARRELLGVLGSQNLVFQENEGGAPGLLRNAFGPGRKPLIGILGSAQSEVTEIRRGDRGWTLRRVLGVAAHERDVLRAQSLVHVVGEPRDVTKFERGADVLGQERQERR